MTTAENPVMPVFLTRDSAGKFSYEEREATAECAHPDEYKAPLSGDAYACGLCDELVDPPPRAPIDPPLAGL
jgi:hypothetical protein